MNNCSYCDELALNRCTTCSQSMCSKHISDHVKDFEKEHKITRHVYFVDLTFGSSYRKRINKRISLLKNLKKDIIMQTKAFITEITTLCAASIKKINETLKEIIDISQTKPDLNLYEYQKFISFFEIKISSELVKIEEPKKYFSQNIFNKVPKYNDHYFKNDFDFTLNYENITEINASVDQNLFYMVPSYIYLIHQKTKAYTYPYTYTYENVYNPVKLINVPELNILISGNNNGFLTIWNTKEATAKVNKQIQTTSVTGLAVTNDNEYIVYASTQGSIKILNIIDLNIKSEIPILSFSIICIALTKNNKFIVSGTGNNTFIVSETGQFKVVVWNFESLGMEYELLGHTQQISCVIISKDDKYIVSGSLDKKIKIWDMESKECVSTLSNNRNSIMNLKFSPNGKYFISGSYDGTINVWNFNRKIIRCTLIGSIYQIFCVDFSPDGKWVYCCSNDSIKGWCLEGKIKLA